MLWKIMPKGGNIKNVRVYLFYKNCGNLDPLLYGFTDNKDVAMEFGNIRKNLHLIKKDCDKDEWRKMRDELRDYLIIPEKLTTRLGQLGSGGVLVYVTEREAEHFRLHCDEIATSLLGYNTINPEIFDDEFRRTLDNFGFSDCYQVCHDEVWDFNRFGILELPHTEGAARLFNGKYKLDELQVFIKYNENTFFEK